MARMSARERVLAAVRGEAVDRPPFAVWRHFYPDENAGAARLAETTVRFTRRHRLDLVKYNPRAHYHAEPWGTAYDYAGDAHPALRRYAVRRPADWTRVEPKTVAEPAFRELLDGLRLVRRALPEVPLLATIFTPLGVLERLAGRERVRTDIRERPDLVLGALEAVTVTFAALARACREVTDGIFLATTTWARRDDLDDGEYERFGLAFDRRVLAAAAGAPLNVLHVCGPLARVARLATEPVAAVSWDTHGPGNPDLAAFLASVPDRAAIGGLSAAAFTAPGTTAIAAEATHALAQTGGRRWVAAGGCTIPTASRPENIDAAREVLSA